MTFRFEPARLGAVVYAVLSALTAIGLTVWTDAQIASIVAAVNTVVALVFGEVVRAQVVPTARVQDLIDYEGDENRHPSAP